MTDAVKVFGAPDEGQIPVDDGEKAYGFQRPSRSASFLSGVAKGSIPGMFGWRPLGPAIPNSDAFEFDPTFTPTERDLEIMGIDSELPFDAKSRVHMDALIAWKQATDQYEDRNRTINSIGQIVGEFDTALIGLAATGGASLSGVAAKAAYQVGGAAYIGSSLIKETAAQANPYVERALWESALNVGLPIAETALIVRAAGKLSTAAKIEMSDVVKARQAAADQVVREELFVRESLEVQQEQAAILRRAREDDAGTMVRAEQQQQGAKVYSEPGTARHQQDVQSEKLNQQKLRSGKEYDNPPDMPGESYADGAKWLNKAGMTPRERLLKSPLQMARDMAEELVSTFLTLEKNKRAIPTRNSVEYEWQIRYVNSRQELIGETNDAYAEYAAKTPRGQRMSKTEFRRAVGVAMHTGDESVVPEVAKAAKSWRRWYDNMAMDIEKADLLTISLRRSLKNQTARLAVIDKKKNPIAYLDAQKEIDSLKAEIDRVRRQGMRKPDNAKSYLNTVVNRAAINDNIDDVVALFATELGVSIREAQEAVLKWIGKDPYRPDFDSIPDSKKLASNLKARSLGIRIEKLMPFLETDVVSVSQLYLRTMGPDIVLGERFGDPMLTDQINAIRNLHRRKIDALKASNASPKELEAAMKVMQRDIQDIEILRDKVRGLHGLPKDPTVMSSRLIRSLKAFNAMTQLTGAIAAIPDVFRIVHTEGIERAFRSSLIGMFEGLDNIKLSRQTLNLAGEGFELTDAMRAMAFADIQDSMSIYGGFERGLHRMSHIGFTINGMNIWNHFIKPVASMAIQTRMIISMDRWVKGKAAQWEVDRLIRAGISKAHARTILQQVEAHGFSGKKELLAGQLDSFNVIHPNVADWDSTVSEARMAFLNALRTDVSTTIVTPSLGDSPAVFGSFPDKNLGLYRARRMAMAAAKNLSGGKISPKEAAKMTETWLTPEIGSLIFQYKTFGMSATSRILAAGLQEDMAKQMIGIMGLVAMGAIIDHIRYRQATNREQDNRPFADRLKGAIDRSGILGVFGDINRSIEMVSNDNLGASMFMPDKPYDVSMTNRVGAILGPSVSTVSNMGQFIGSLTDLNPMDARSARLARKLTPGQNYAHLDFAYDKIEAAARSMGRLISGARSKISNKTAQLPEQDRPTFLADVESFAMEWANDNAQMGKAQAEEAFNKAIDRFADRWTASQAN